MAGAAPLAVIGLLYVLLATGWAVVARRRGARLRWTWGVPWVGAGLLWAVLLGDTADGPSAGLAVTGAVVGSVLFGAWRATSVLLTQARGLGAGRAPGESLAAWAHRPRTGVSPRPGPARAASGRGGARGRG